MTDTGTIAVTPNRPNRLLDALVITGIAVGIFIIAAGLYVLIAKPGFCGSMNMESMNMMEQSVKKAPESPMPMPTTTP